MFGPGAHIGEAAFDLIGNLGLGQPAALQVEADQIGNRRANADEVVGQVEQLLITAVPGHQSHLAIYQSHALIDALDRGLEQVGRKVEASACLAEHGHDFR